MAFGSGTNSGCSTAIPIARDHHSEQDTCGMRNVEFLMHNRHRELTSGLPTIEALSPSIELSVWVNLDCHPKIGTRIGMRNFDFRVPLRNRGETADLRWAAGFCGADGRRRYFRDAVLARTLWSAG